MRRIVHLSDLHFGSEDPAVVAGLTAELNADPPDLVAVSGDLTLGARSGEFRAARAFLDGLRSPVLCVPGNHDLTPYKLMERFFDPYGRWRAHIGPEIEPVFQDGEIGVVGLNTARRGGLYLDWSRGRIGTSDLLRCEARLAALPAGLVRVVVAHHPFLPPRSAPGARVVGGAKAALAAFGRQGVRLLLSGHLHLGDVAEPAAAAGADPVGITHGGGGGAATASAGAGLTVVLSATTTSRRLRGEPNAYNDIRVWPEGRVAIAVRAWDASAARWRNVEPTAAAPPAVSV